MSAAHALDTAAMIVATSWFCTVSVGVMGVLLHLVRRTFNEQKARYHVRPSVQQ